MAFLNNKTEFNLTIDSGKQFQTSVIRQAKNDLRQFITDKGLTSIGLTTQNEL